MDPEPKNFNRLILIPLCLARAGASPGEAPAILARAGATCAAAYARNGQLAAEITSASRGNPQWRRERSGMMMP